MFFFLGLWASKFYYRFFEKNKDADRMGIVALKFDDKFLYHIAKPKLVIAVTGTNGKTTTCNLLAELFEKEGYKVAFNIDGCNMRPGLSKALILKTSIFNKAKTDVAILEFDELSTKELLEATKPDIVVCTNLFMDTMGRNGHIDYVFNKINEGLPKDSKLILNGDDLISSQLGKSNNGNRVFFSIPQQENEVSKAISNSCDIKVCPNCLSKLEFDFIRYHHIGKAHCPNCSFKNEKADYVLERYDDKNMVVNGESYPLINDSLFNIYNQLAAIAVAKECGLKNIAESFSKMQIVKSRFFSEKIGNVDVVFQMTKGQNPVSLSRAMDYVSNLKGKKNIIIIIDDLFDIRSQERSEVISYIYNTDYECLNKEDISRIIIGGVRYADYKVRLLMASVPEEKIFTTDDEKKTLDMLEEDVQTIAVVHDIYQYRNADVILEKIKERFGK